MQRLLAVAAAIVSSIVLSLLTPAGVRGAGASAAAEPPSLPALHAQGREIRDEKNQVVRLHGVDIGGWLVTEAWMCGQTDDGKRLALEQLEARFGPEKAAKLMSAWQDNWFTTADLDNIKGYGFNVIRVPFGWRTLVDAAGKIRRDAKGSVDFGRMDWVVREAGRRGIYVVFDLHTWPGEYGVISRQTTAGAKARAEAAALWAEVARHYRGVGTIAAFDVINEPEGSPGNVLQQAFYDAIRAQDGRRMLMVESVSYPSLRTQRWNNVIWSAHYPENALKSGSAAERLAEFDRKEKISTTPQVAVPIFIGEAKAPEDNAASAAELAKAFNDRGWQWTIWTYKGVDNGGWASFNYGRELKYNLATDPYDDILHKWTEGLSQWRDASGDAAKPKNDSMNKWWIEGFTGRAPS